MQKSNIVVEMIKLLAYYIYQLQLGRRELFFFCCRLYVLYAQRTTDLFVVVAEVYLFVTNSKFVTYAL